MDGDAGTDLRVLTPAIPAAVATAVVAALSQLDELVRDKTAKVATKTGGEYRYNYTDLASVMGYVRPILAAHDLCVMQPVTSAPGQVTVSTILMHKSGCQIGFPPFTLNAGSTAQDAGSAVSYARRYALLAALGLATEDDDGKAATTATADRRQSNRAPKQATEAQLRTLGIRLRGAGYDRDAGLAFIAEHAGREVSTSKDLTSAEASKVIAALPAEPPPSSADPGPSGPPEGDQP